MKKMIWLILGILLLCILGGYIAYDHYHKDGSVTYLVPLSSDEIKRDVIQGIYGTEVRLIEPSYAHPIRYPDFVIQDVSQASLTARLPRDFRPTSFDGKTQYLISYRDSNSLEMAKEGYWPPRYFNVDGIEYKLEFLNTEEGTLLADDALIISIEAKR